MQWDECCSYILAFFQETFSNGSQCHLVFLQLEASILFFKLLWYLAAWKNPSTIHVGLMATTRTKVPQLALGTSTNRSIRDHQNNGWITQSIHLTRHSP